MNSTNLQWRDPSESGEIGTSFQEKRQCYLLVFITLFLLDPVVEKNIVPIFNGSKMMAMQYRTNKEYVPGNPICKFHNRSLLRLCASGCSMQYVYSFSSTHFWMFLDVTCKVGILYSFSH